MVSTGLENPNSASAIRRRLTSFPISYQTQVGRKLMDDGMRAHYQRVKSQHHEVDDSMPSKSHYDYLKDRERRPTFKKTVTDQHVFDKIEATRLHGLAMTAAQTDSSAPLVTRTNKYYRDKFRRRIQQLPGFKASAAHVIQWSPHEEAHALEYLSKFGRVCAMAKGWTDHGPPEQAMAYRKFRRSFKKQSIVNMSPPPDMYMSGYDKANKKPGFNIRLHKSAHEKELDQRKLERSKSRKEARGTVHVDDGNVRPTTVAEPGLRAATSLLPMRRLCTPPLKPATHPQGEDEHSVRARSAVDIHSDALVHDDKAELSFS